MPAPLSATKRPPQFSLTALLVVMAVCSLASAPAYYLMRAQKGVAGSQLIGMLFLLTGPLFLMVLLSLLLSAIGYNKRR